MTALAEQTQPLDMEHRLRAAGELTVKQAQSLTIKSQEDYTHAADMLRDIKTRAKEVADYWAQPKQTAAAAHKQICQREKDMLTPLDQAERVIKTTMTTYSRAVEEARRKAEAEALRLQREEADRLLREAAEADASGDTVGAEITLNMAQMVEEMKVSQAVSAPAPVAAGISTRKVWKARVTDPAKVPVEMGGLVIRPIDEALLNKLAVTSKGTMIIPGVEMYQEESLSARGW